MKVVRIRDVVSVIGGGTPRRSTADFYGGSIPWVTPKDMKVPVISGSQVTLTEEGLSNSPAKLVPPGSTLVVVRSGVLKHTLPVAITDVPVALNQDMKALVPHQAVHPPWLARLVKSLQPTVLTWVRATTADNFPIDNLLDLEIELLPLDEQRRIAAILDHADAVRNSQGRVLTQLNELAPAIFLDMFGPYTGEFVTVEEIAEKQKGSIRTGPFGSQLLHSEFVDEGIAVLGLDNVVGNTFGWGERRYITPEKYEGLRRYTVRPGDVLVSIMGTCGRCVVVPQDVGIAINTKHICAITVDPDRAVPEFVRAAFLWHPRSRQHLSQRTKGSIMDGLNMGIVKEMPLPMPPLLEQRQFVDRLRQVEDQRAACLESAASLDDLFESLQGRAFAGRL